MLKTRRKKNEGNEKNGKKGDGGSDGGGGGILTLVIEKSHCLEIRVCG